MAIIKICPVCLSIDQKINNDLCPLIGCFGKLINIDESLVPIIYNFWNNNISTLFCCEGHFVGFIRFKPYIIFKFEEKEKKYLDLFVDIIMETAKKLKMYIPYIIEKFEPRNINKFDKNSEKIYKLSVCAFNARNIEECKRLNIENYSNKLTLKTDFLKLMYLVSIDENVINLFKTKNE